MRAALLVVLLSAVAGSGPLHGHEAEARDLERRLGERRAQLAELLRAASESGVQLTSVEIDALGRSSRWLEQGRHHSGHDEREADDEGDSGHDSGHRAAARSAHGVESSHHAEQHSRHSLHGHHSEHGEHGEDGELEEHFEAWDIDTSIMLLGLISFVMMLFYLTNWPDDDIRLYSWQITSATISIFCAVLLFQGFNGVLEYYFAHRLHWSERAMTTLHFGCCIGYLIVMQFGVAIESGVLLHSEDWTVRLTQKFWVYAEALRCDNGEKVEAENLPRIRAAARRDETATKSVLVMKEGSGDVEIPVEKKMQEFLKARRRTKAIATLCAHMAGFAAICSGSSLQQVVGKRTDVDMLPDFAGKLIVWLPLLVNQVLLRVAFKLLEIVRDCRIHSLKERVGRQHTAYREEYLEGIEMIEELMKEECVESENDVSSLSLSFLTVNVVRYCITGQLPNVEGEEPEWWSPKVSEVLQLYAFGLGALAVAGVQAVIMKTLNITELTVKLTLYRVLVTFLNATAMTFAWCFLWATKWACLEFGVFKHEILARVSMAFALNLLACAMVFLVDKVDDSLKARANKTDLMHDQTGHDNFVKEFIRVIITALGILVGFSWEHCFDGSVWAVSSKTEMAEDFIPEEVHAWHRIMPVLFKLVLGIMLCMLVLPAWRRYILQKVLLMESLMAPVTHTDQETHIDQDPRAAHSGRSGESQPLLPAMKQLTGGVAINHHEDPI